MKQNKMAYATLPMVQDTAFRHDRAFFKVSGVCMEGVGIHDGDYVLVDFRKMPRPPRKGAGAERDICLCADESPDYVGVKEYLGRWGGFHVVGDHPVRKEGDLLIAAGHLVNQIWGVVSACYSADWLLRWERDISDCPADLPTVSTIHGDNCGEPESAGERVKAAP